MHPLMTLIGGALLAYAKIATFPASISAHVAKAITVIVTFTGLALIGFAKREKLPMLNKLPRFTSPGSFMAGALSLAAALVAVVAEALRQANFGGPATQILLTVIGGASALFFAKEDLPAVGAPTAMLMLAFGTFVGLPACAGAFHDIQDNLPAITADVNQASLVVGTIETFVDGYMANHTVDPGTVAKVDAGFVKVKLAISAIQSVARGAGDLQGEQAQAALTEFYSAYTELLALVKSFGVTPSAAPTPQGTARMSATPGGLVVPAPRDMALAKRRKV